MFRSGNDQLLSHLCPILASQLANGVIQDYIYTAFLLSVDEAWFVVSAGHCAGNLERASKSTSNQDLKVHLLDGNSSHAISTMPVPYSYSPDKVFFLHKDGLDYALFPIHESTRSLLEANGMVPLAEDMWSYEPPDNCSYALLGVREKAWKVTRSSGQFHVKLRHSLNRIERLAECPADLTPEPGKSFFGKVTLNCEQPTIEGMSGGPIFAFHANGNGVTRYWLAALQSGWRQSSRHIFGCLIKPFGEAVRPIVQECRRNAV